jgi:ABC-2 type transport system ATP-binding protein
MRCEPANGLDPEGIRWIRQLMKSLAAEGRVVFVSSHLINEMANTADRLIVIGAGKLLADTTVAELSAGSASLEDAFLDLTMGSAEFRATPAGSPDDGPPGGPQAGRYPSYPAAGRSS